MAADGKIRGYLLPRTFTSIRITCRHFTTFVVRIGYIISRIRLELVYPIYKLGEKSYTSLPRAADQWWLQKVGQVCPAVGEAWPRRRGRYDKIRQGITRNKIDIFPSFLTGDNERPLTAGNAISEALSSNILRGSMPPNPHKYVVTLA